MEFEESIYNLIPKEQHVPIKDKRYKSQFPGKLQPTASTFGLGTTSKPQCANLSGKYNLEGGSHSHIANGATMGAPKGAAMPKTDGFRKKGTGNPVLVPKMNGKSNKLISAVKFIFRLAKPFGLVINLKTSRII